MTRPLLGVVHLPPLPSARGHRSMADVLAVALADARAYARTTFDPQRQVSAYLDLFARIGSARR